jgi:hypothetical protein
MPWRLQYANDIDGRVTLNGHRALFRESQDVLSISEGRHPHPWLEVTFRGEAEGVTTEDPVLLRLFQEHQERTRAVSGPHIGPNLNRDDLVLSVHRAIRTPEGRARLAASMVTPLRQIWGYQSIAQQTFLVEQLPESAPSPYLQNLDVTPAVPPVRRTPMDQNLWVKPGAWGYNERRDEYHLVLERREPHPAGEVYVQCWRSPKPPEWFDIDFFYENWTPCEKPEDPAIDWDRLLGFDIE